MCVNSLELIGQEQPNKDQDKQDSIEQYLILDNFDLARRLRKNRLRVTDFEELFKERKLKQIDFMTSFPTLVKYNQFNILHHQILEHNKQIVKEGVRPFRINKLLSLVKEKLQTISFLPPQDQHRNVILLLKWFRQNYTQLKTNLQFTRSKPRLITELEKQIAEVKHTFKTMPQERISEFRVVRHLRNKAATPLFSVSKNKGQQRQLRHNYITQQQIQRNKTLAVLKSEFKQETSLIDSYLKRKQTIQWQCQSKTLLVSQKTNKEYYNHLPLNNSMLALAQSFRDITVLNQVPRSQIIVQLPLEQTKAQPTESALNFETSQSKSPILSLKDRKNAIKKRSLKNMQQKQSQWSKAIHHQQMQEVMQLKLNLKSKSRPLFQTLRRGMVSQKVQGLAQGKEILASTLQSNPFSQADKKKSRIK